MTDIDCIACVHADEEGNCTLGVTLTSFVGGCLDFVEKMETQEERFERILESASAQVPLRGKREENRPIWQQDREGGAE